MRINITALENAGFHTELRKDAKGNIEEINIWPNHGRDITPDLMKITGLGMRDCCMLQDDIVDLQVIQAIKSTN